LGQGLSMLFNLINPDRVVLYGSSALVDEHMRPSAEIFMRSVRESSVTYAFSTAGQDATLLSKPYNEDVGALAAAAVAMRRLGRK
jgi:predicted NBD/HSP70 family sugar kinase